MSTTITAASIPNQATPTAGTVRTFVEQNKVAVFITGALLTILTVVFAMKFGMADIVKKAACNKQNNGVNCNGKGLEGFTQAAGDLISPIVVAMIAIAPLGCLVGAGALMFGNRRGLVIIGSALGTLVFVASLKGIVE